MKENNKGNGNNSNMTVRVRYAPSPTGHIHIGNARSALFNYLFAKQNNGVMILRLDDTDRKRSTDDAIKTMLEDISWLGIEWDEGYLKGGLYGPYRQTERMDLYNKYIDILLKEGKAYNLYYTEEEIKETRKRYEKQNKKFNYREIKENETEARRNSFKQTHPNILPAVVFKIEDREEIIVNDLVRGKVTFNSNDFSDFVIRRTNGIPVYNYATVIDDALMKITHIIRAEEHLSNTPKQLLIYDALNFPHPLFAHVSLILAPDRTKLSKRHGATSVGEYRDKGFLPEALINYLALLGWSPKDNREFFTKEELINLFTLENVNKAPAVFDINKLKWMNHRYMENLSAEEIILRAKEINIHFPKMDLGWWKELIETAKEHLITLSDIAAISNPFFKGFVFEEGVLYELKQFEPSNLLKTFKENLTNVKDWNMTETLSTIRKTGKELKIKGRNLYYPLRLAITGSKEGLEIHEFVYFLGKEKTLKRIEFAIKELKDNA